jgi:hypothetical protein
VWSWRLDAGVNSVMMLRITLGMVARKPITRESTKQPLKPPCRESRIAPAYLWSNSCAFFAAHEAAGALSIRLSLRPLFRGGMFFKTRAVFGCGKARP